MKILGIAALYHDSSACIIENGEILSAVQRKDYKDKTRSITSSDSINYCLNAANTQMKDLKLLYFTNPQKTRQGLALSTDQIQQSQPTVRQVKFTANRMWIEEALGMNLARLVKTMS